MISKGLSAEEVYDRAKRRRIIIIVNRHNTKTGMRRRGRRGIFNTENCVTIII